MRGLWDRSENAGPNAHPNQFCERQSHECPFAALIINGQNKGTRPEAQRNRPSITKLGIDIWDGMEPCPVYAGIIQKAQTSKSNCKCHR